MRRSVGVKHCSGSQKPSLALTTRIPPNAAVTDAAVCCAVSTGPSPTCLLDVGRCVPDIFAPSQTWSVEDEGMELANLRFIQVAVGLVRICPPMRGGTRLP